MMCKQCSGPVPTFVYGVGEWAYIPTPEGGTAERGPYCSKACMEQANR